MVAALNAQQTQLAAQGRAAVVDAVVVASQAEHPSPVSVAKAASDAASAQLDSTVSNSAQLISNLVVLASGAESASVNSVVCCRSGCCC